MIRAANAANSPVRRRKRWSSLIEDISNSCCLAQTRRRRRGAAGLRESDHHVDLLDDSEYCSFAVGSAGVGDAIEYAVLAEQDAPVRPRTIVAAGECMQDALRPSRHSCGGRAQLENHAAAHNASVVVATLTGAAVEVALGIKHQVARGRRAVAGIYVVAVEVVKDVFGPSAA